MILSDKDIKIALQSGEIVIDPFFTNAIQPASVDLHLGSKFLIFKLDAHTLIDPKEPVDNMMTAVEIDPHRQFILHPGQFALGQIYETTGVGNGLVGRLEGKSSLGRIGLIIHVTAGYLDPGNKLKMTLELHNVSPLPMKLYYRMPIAQMAFERLTSDAEKPYGKSALGSKYYGDMGPKASEYYKNFLHNNEWFDYSK